MSTARPIGDLQQQLCVAPSDEAFAVLVWENHRDFWITRKEKDDKDKRGKKRKAANKNKEGEEDDDEEEEPDNVGTLYTILRGGVKHCGGWTNCLRKAKKGAKSLSNWPWIPRVP